MKKTSRKTKKHPKKNNQTNIDHLEVPETAEKTVVGFPIVGIGASAGGLAAIEAFFAGMPADTEVGMAFVLVQHLAPDHKSILTDLVRRFTRMQVFEVENGMAVKPNCVYIIPPNQDMALLDGTLELLKPVTLRGQRLTIDFFFRSLAHDQHERAICIVLSGTGSDGTLGLREVKGEGGMAMAQSLDSAEYDGMPRSVIATGLVDYILPPAEMPAQIIAYVGQAFGKKNRLVSLPTPGAGEALKKIFILLRDRTRRDFSQYKQSTIIRRIKRRMVLHQVEHQDGYVRYLQQNPAEVDFLFRDILIGVTNFFRDPEAFAALEAQVIPHLFVGKSAGASIRVWVPGCSTGEEAYSIAILLQEHLEALKRNLKVQVFASDIDRRALEQARAGVYPASISADVSTERLARFFSQEPDGSSYRINKGIRDMLAFPEQDVIVDPPFSKLDLISCRNLLIYMGGELQKRLIPLFHHALNPGGFLFLGTSETVGEFMGLFATLDRKSKLYQRREHVHGANRPARGRFLPQLTENVKAPRPTGKTPGEYKLHLRKLAELVLLQDYAPVGALVNEHGDILYLHGRTGRYLEPAPGESGMNILKMAREGLRLDLTAALRKVVVHKKPVRRPGVRVKTNGDFTTVNLTVQSVPAGPRADAEPNRFLVVFEEAPAHSTSSGQAVDPERHEQAAVVDAGEDAGESAAEVDGFDRLTADARIAALRQELRAKEKNLKTNNEDMAILIEELKSSNEEMQSTNEELQSTNEELETSKEELQSVNEELTTINAELQNNMADLARANNDMNNLMASTGIGTVFLDNQLRVQRFTPAITGVINLILSDVGRPVGHIVSNLTGYDRLVEDVREVLDTLVPKEIEVQTKAGAWFLLRIQLYRTLENAIEGAVITFVDITEMKRVQAMLRESEAQIRLAVVLRDSRDCVTVHDLNGRILAWNPGAERVYGWSEAEALGMNIRDLVPEGLREEALTIMRRLGRAEVLETDRMKRITKDGRIVEVWMTATALVNGSGETYAIANTERVTKSGTVD
ncbi:MAG: PAS domain-containing protein [Proteobacteria bacterium]|nr:PAS domain-containing protein [Pseudomonadota bacterium]